jgi:ankyrin repeat protein
MDDKGSDALDQELCMVLHSGKEERALELLEKGARADASWGDGTPAIVLAAQKGLDRAFMALLDGGAGAGSCCISGVTPLHWAAHKGNLAMAEILLARGADPDAREIHGDAPLHKACLKNPCDALVVALLEAGADVSAQASNGDTPLHYAAMLGHVSAARILIERGADIDAIGGHGSTPLHNARREPEVAELLGFHKADPGIRDQFGEEALDKAHPETTRAFRQGSDRRNAMEVKAALESSLDQIVPALEAQKERDRDDDARSKGQEKSQGRRI